MEERTAGSHELKSNPSIALRATVLLLLWMHSATAGGQRRSRGDALQPIIDRSAAGDTVLVDPGTYTGNLFIARRISLLGIGDPVLRGPGTGSVVTITADSCTISGFVIEHCGTMLVDEDAGILVKSNYNVIERNTLRDILFGIYFYHAGWNNTTGNTITGRTELSLGERGSGVHIWNSHYNTFRENTITRERDGFYIQNANHLLIQRNEVSELRYGLHYMYADSNAFLDNDFHDNVAGAAIMYSKDITFRNNNFSHNRGFASFGILFQDCHNSIADSNTVSDNVVGMFLEASTENLFRRNVIARNDAALEMYQNATGNTFTENNFIGNLTPLLLAGKQTGTRWSSGGRGNYWSSYNGYDLDGDGIGDVPMKIQNVFQFLEGKNANVRLYLYSPASQALSAATETFPIITINREVDNHPLMRPVRLDARSRGGRSSPASSSATLAAFVFAPLAGFAVVAAAFLIAVRGRWR
jgi:nitrous oxidase accessory protein